MDKTYNATITCTDIYGTSFDNLKAPDGWKFTGEFRVVQNGEYWLSNYKDIARHSNIISKCYYGCGQQPDETKPRLILRRVVKNKRMRFIFEPTGEVRSPEHGDFYLYENMIDQACCRLVNKYPIYTRRIEEYEVEE